MLTTDVMTAAADAKQPVPVGEKSRQYGMLGGQHSGGCKNTSAHFGEEWS